jgi:phenylacetate-CoA ligase
MTDSQTADLGRRQELRSMARESLERQQFERLREMLVRIVPENTFYRQRFVEAGLLDVSGANEINFPRDRAELAKLPLTTKSELVGDGSRPFAANLTWPVDDYVRFHRTSGTHGHPMVVLDTAEDWRWWIEGWQHVLDVAEVTATDRAVMAFSFGPFVGFWSAFDATAARGALVIPTGAMTTLARLDLIKTTSATVVFCTPSYALHMAEVAAEHGVDIANSSVRKIIVAGEPGGSIPATREKIESAWGAEVVDHSGASEIGPWGFADKEGSGIYVNETNFLPELISVDDGQLIPFESVPLRSSIAKDAANNDVATTEGLAELILTTLGRDGCPVIRYRTGDLVRPVINDRGTGSSQFLFLEGGVLGRADDMMIIRGVNVFPASVESILREIPEVVEYRMTATKAGQMDQLKVELEATAKVDESVAELLSTRLGLRIDVSQVADGELPRFEAKGKRFVDLRGNVS